MRGPARPRRPIAPINIFRVHEKTLIQPADLRKRFAPNHQDRANHVVNRKIVARVPLAHAIRPFDARSRQERVRKLVAQHGERPARKQIAGRLPRAVRVQQARSGDADRRMRIHERHHLPERVLLQHGVAVQQQQITAFRLPQRLIIGSGKADILLIADEPRLRKFPRRHLRAAVG